MESENINLFVQLKFFCYYVSTNEFWAAAAIYYDKTKIYEKSIKP